MSLFSPDYRVLPYLTVKGGKAAIKFYEEAFDADVVSCMMAEDGERIMHAELEINHSPLMLSDEFPEMGTTGGTIAPSKTGQASVAIHFDLKRPKYVDRFIASAEKAGATVIMPPQDTFWGARYGRVRDPFGHVWAFHAPLKK